MSRHIFQSALVRQLLLYSILLGGFFVLLSTSWIIYSSYQRHQQGINYNLQQIASQTPSIAASLYVLDRQQIEIQLTGLLNLPGVVFLQVEENLQPGEQPIQQGDVLATRDRVKQYPLVVTDSTGRISENLGQLTAVVNMEYFYQQLRLDAWNAFITSSLGIGLIILAVFLLFHIKVIRHLLSITEFTSKLELDQLNSQLTLDRNKQAPGHEDEVSLLVSAINEMRKRIIRELEQRQTAHEQLKHSETNLRTLVETIPDMVWVKDNNGTYLSCNPMFERLFGASEADIVGKTDFDFVDEKLATFFRNQDQLAAAHGGPRVNEETVTFASDGHTEILETIKAPMYDSNGKPIGILGIARDISERVQARNRLKLQDELLNEMGRLANIGGWEFDVKSGKGTWTEQVAKIHGMDIEAYTNADIGLSFFQGKDRKTIEEAIQQAIKYKIPYDLTLKMTTADGVEKYVRTIGHPLLQDDKVVKLHGSIQDVSEQKFTELALQRSQKMDAVGQLTGGIAHDFNNILGIILGNLDLLKLNLSDKDKTVKRIKTIQKSAQRASNLTRQLLGFSRLQPAKVEITNINQLISNMDSLIAHSITPQIEFEQVLAADLWLTDIDPGDFEDSLLNLVLNARDAMTGEGQLTVETQNTILDSSYCRKNPEAKVGDYVQLTVSDNGPGIPHKEQDRIFEPFFTTKEHSKGTGLGLSMVYGFSKRSKGSIKVYSEPGIGTTFRLYMPRAEGKEKTTINQSTELTDRILAGSETLLVVDDEIDLLELAEESLSQLGYQIITAHDADESLDKLKQYPHIKLLFSDVVMPGRLNGYELAEQAVALYPALKVLLTSGYTQKVIAKNGQARFDTTLLSKPYTQLALAQQIREILDTE